MYLKLLPPVVPSRVDGAPLVALAIGNALVCQHQVTAHGEPTGPIMNCRHRRDYSWGLGGQVSSFRSHKVGRLESNSGMLQPSTQETTQRAIGK